MLLWQFCREHYFPTKANYGLVTRPGSPTLDKGESTARDNEARHRTLREGTFGTDRRPEGRDGTAGFRGASTEFTRMAPRPTAVLCCCICGKSGILAFEKSCDLGQVFIPEGAVPRQGRFSGGFWRCAAVRDWASAVFW